MMLACNLVLGKKMELYRFLHFTGILFVFTALGALCCFYAVGKEKSDPGFRSLAISHGVGMILSLFGGFGMAARLGISSSPWVMTKLALWLVFGASMVMVRKIQSLKSIGLISALGALTVYIAVFRPF